MNRQISPDRQHATAPIFPWRIVAGAFAHFVLPFYLAGALACVMLHEASDVTQALHLALAASPALLGGYLATAIVATGLAAMLEPLLQARRRKRRARHPRAAALQSERLLRQTIGDARALPGPRAQAALAILAAAPWDHDDPRQQALSRDLAQTVETSARAIASASVDRREEIVGLVAAAIERIAAAQAELIAVSAREDEQQARIVAGYVESRYGTSSLSG